jgi:pimeloyl-ACP methyl ester carboxylesterase
MSACESQTLSEHVIGPPTSPLFRLGQWADDAKRADGTFPLIVLSHGTGGSAQVMAWLDRDLASRGYVVAAVNHPGNNALDDYTAEGFLTWWERARDLTTVIDMLLQDGEFGRVIDRRRWLLVGRIHDVHDRRRPHGPRVVSEVLSRHRGRRLRRSAGVSESVRPLS